MTGERKIFSHLDEDISDFDNITFGDDSKGGVKGIGEVPISKDYNLSNVFVTSWNFLRNVSNAKMWISKFRFEIECIIKI
jgi:hypothetical protein